MCKASIDTSIVAVTICTVYVKQQMCVLGWSVHRSCLLLLACIFFSLQSLLFKLEKTMFLVYTWSILFWYTIILYTRSHTPSSLVVYLFVYTKHPCRLYTYSCLTLGCASCIFGLYFLMVVHAAILHTAHFKLNCASKVYTFAMAWTSQAHKSNYASSSRDGQPGIPVTWLSNICSLLFLLCLVLCVEQLLQLLVYFVHVLYFLHSMQVA